MGDEMDPCECLWNHELAMRRLISLLRQGQSYCTESECLEQLPGLPQPESAGNSFIMMFVMMAFALAMYMMRPRRNQIQDAAKPAHNPHDRDGAPLHLQEFNQHLPRRLVHPEWSLPPLNSSYLYYKHRVVIQHRLDVY